MPVDVIRGLQGSSKDKTYNDYVERVKSNLSSAYERASACAAKQHSRNKQRYDSKAWAAPLEVGDRVLVRKVHFKEGPRKLEDKWEDKVYIVVAIPEDKLHVYDVRIEEDVKAKVRRLHRNLLLPMGSIISSTVFCLPAASTVTPIRAAHPSESQRFGRPTSPTSPLSSIRII